jgi:hypothetical protein
LPIANPVASNTIACIIEVSLGLTLPGRAVTSNLLGGVEEPNPTDIVLTIPPEDADIVAMPGVNADVR